MPGHVPASSSAHRRLSQLRRVVSQAQSGVAHVAALTSRPCGSSSATDARADTPVAWQAAAREAALALPNRGPIELDETGRLQPHILRSLEELGFYVFTGVISEEELSDLRADLTHVLARSSTHSTSGAVTPDQAAQA